MRRCSRLPKAIFHTLQDLGLTRPLTATYWLLCLALAIYLGLSTASGRFDLVLGGGMCRDFWAVFAFGYTFVVGFALYAFWDIGRTRRRQRKLARHPISVLRDSQVFALSRKHADVILTLHDSVASGNCLKGSRQFAREHFPGRRSITVGEALRFAHADKRVMKVLRYKMVKLGVPVHLGGSNSPAAAA